MNLENNSIAPSLSIKSVDTSFFSVLNSEHIEKELRNDIGDANALLIPKQGYIDRTDLIYFPSGTSELYQFLVDKQEKNFTVDISISEKDYKELALHADWMFIADFIVREVAAPLLATLIADYIIKTVGKRKDKTNVKSKIIVVDNSDTFHLEYYYEGPATEYENVMVEAIESFSDHKKLDDGG